MSAIDTAAAAMATRDFRASAEEHMPKTPAEIAATARDLISQGYSDHTAAAILKIDVAAIRQMIGAPVDGGRQCAT
jgi:hypothetical protein